MLYSFRIRAASTDEDRLRIPTEKTMEKMAIIHYCWLYLVENINNTLWFLLILQLGTYKNLQLSFSIPYGI